MSAVIDLIGVKFGKLTVVAKAESTAKGKHWTCACECGALTEVRSDNLRRAKTSSCGCEKLHGLDRFRAGRISEMSEEFLNHMRTLPGQLKATERAKHWLTWQAARCNDTAPVAPIGDEPIIAQYQHRYVGDPRQRGIWENSRNIDWAKRIWEECEDHIDPINKWEVRALVLAAMAEQGE